MLSLLNGDYIMVGGDFNDQLFGSDLYQVIINHKGIEHLYENYNRDNIISIFEYVGMNKVSSNIWYTILDEQIRHTNLCEIKTIKDFFWWLNFSYKWQSVYFRLISRSTNRKILSKEFKSWVELTGPIFEGLGSDITDVVAQKIWLALLEGGLLPIISLASLHFFIKYGGVDDEKINTPAEEISTPVENIETQEEVIEPTAVEQIIEPELIESETKIDAVELPAEELPAEEQPKIRQNPLAINMRRQTGLR
jgi:hypothetical protein